MTYKKFGLGLLVVAIGMMAFAASAQAATLGILIGANPALHATVTATQEEPGFLLVPALNLELRCVKFSVQEGLILSSTVAHGKLLFEECTPLEFNVSLKEIETCHVVASAVDTKLHVTATALLLPAELSNGEPALLAEKIVALVLFLGAECPLPTDNTVTGELCLKINPSTNYTTEPLVLSDPTIQGECKSREVLEGKEVTSGGVKDVLKYGAQTANVDLKAKLKLTGGHTGLTFGVKLNP